MAQHNTGTGRDMPVDGDPPTPLPVTAAWPVRAGSVPPLADRYTIRPETGPDLAVALDRSAVVALTPRGRRVAAPAESGLLGCTGKTQLAVQHAEAQWQARAIDLLLWVDASTRESILSAYADAAAALTGARRAGSAESTATSFLHWLNLTDRRWLIVLDDLPDASVVEGLWPLGAAGRLIVTAPSSGSVAGWPDALVLEVGAFSLREAMSYLVSRLSPDPDQRRGAIALVEDLGCQPLALTQATAAISSSWMTCADYRDQFYRRLTVLTGPGGAPAAAGVTWTLSVDLAGQLVTVDSAQSCLAFAAFLDGHGIPAAVFESEAAHRYVGGAQEPGAQAAERARSALIALDQSGLVLIDRQADPPRVRMNAALQRAVRQAMSPDLAEHAALAAAAALLEAWPPEGRDSLTAHAMRASAACLQHASGELLWADGCHPVLLRAGRSLDEARLTGPAVDYWADLAIAADQVLGPAHPDSVVIVERLASAYVAAGRVSEAVAWYKRMLADWSRTVGADHPRTLTARVKLGRVLVSAGLYEDAIGVLTAALTDAERAYGAGHPECSAIRDEVAAGYRAAGELSSAIRLYELILSERERRLGSMHPETTAARQALAEAFLAAGRTKDAFSQYKKVVADRQRSLGRDHPDALRATAALASAYHKAGRMALAVQMYEQVHQGFDRVLGPDDRDSLAAAVTLGQIYFAVGRLTDASDLLRDSITRGDRVLAPSDPLMRQARDGLAAIVPD